MQREHALRRRHTLFERRFRLLDDTDVVTVVGEGAGHTFPTGTDRPGSMHQDDIRNAIPGALL